MLEELMKEAHPEVEGVFECMTCAEICRVAKLIERDLVWVCSKRHRSEIKDFV